MVTSLYLYIFIGTGLRASVMVCLPEFNKLLEGDNQAHKELLEEVCSAFQLQPRGSAGEHSAAVGAKFDVSNKQRLGFSEVSYHTVITHTTTPLTHTLTPLTHTLTHTLTPLTHILPQCFAVLYICMYIRYCFALYMLAYHNLVKA